MDTNVYLDFQLHSVFSCPKEQFCLKVEGGAAVSFCGGGICYANSVW